MNLFMRRALTLAPALLVIALGLERVSSLPGNVCLTCSNGLLLGSRVACQFESHSLHQRGIANRLSGLRSGPRVNGEAISAAPKAVMDGASFFPNEQPRKIAAFLIRLCYFMSACGLLFRKRVSARRGGSAARMTSDSSGREGR
jgi:hypothetical protein